MNPDFLFKLLEEQVIEGKYHLKKLLGVGGFGAVFRADEVVRDRVLREVAVKVILPTGTAAEEDRQLDELLTAVNLDHPHLIRCFAAGEFTDDVVGIGASWLYLVMELAEYSLQTQVERQPLGNAEIKEVMVQLAMALEYLHDQNLVHRDLKPANVLWAKKVWKISDFGTVRSLNTQSYLQTANPTGTIPYMPPEAFDGTVSPAWDIWSLGILGVVAATRTLPYEFTDPYVLQKRVMNAEVQLGSLSSELKLIIQPCLQLERRNRCTAKQVIQAVTAPPIPQVPDTLRIVNASQVAPPPLLPVTEFPGNRVWRLLEGSVIKGRYYLEKLLGVGGYGAVFRASEMVLDHVIRRLAVKLILVEDSNRQLRGLEIALNVEHPNLIRCFSGGETVLQNQPFLFLLMELAEYSLEERLQQGTLTSEETKQLLQDVAAGLAYLHNSGRVHRDLSPRNLFWVEGRWKIGDFGLTRQMNSNANQMISKLAAGSPGFAPSEAHKGVYYPAGDIWSLGIVTVYALTRQLPFNFQTEEELYRCVIDCRLSLPKLPEPFSSIVKGCLNKDPVNRWTAEQVIQAVTAPRHQPVVPPIRRQEPAPSLPQPQRQNYQETLSKGIFSRTILEMVAIPGGTFLMGSPAGEGQFDEHPLHRVTVPSFYMGKYVVTNAQWKAVMGSNPASKYDSKFQGDHQPVVGVSWDDARSFCQKLSQMSGKIYRLPSEAEWEYGCRAGSETLYSFGNGENQLGNYAWYRANSSGQTHPVGKKQGNAFGLYDMHGNVWEWCEDDYDWHGNYEGAPSDGRAWVEADRTNTERILRGGSWDDVPVHCRSAYRGDFTRGGRSFNFGFRVCCVPPQDSPLALSPFSP